MRFHRRHAEWVVGLFVLAALALLAGLFIAVGIQNQWFEGRILYYARFDHPGGLTPGAVVLVGGLAAGRVSDVRLVEGPRVVVTLRLSRPYAEFIRADSVARIETTALVGSPALSISTGSPGAAPLAPGAFIPTAPPAVLGVADLSRLLQSASRLIDRLADPQSPLWRSLDRLDALAETLSSRQTDLGEAVRHAADTTRLAHDVLARLDAILKDQPSFPIRLTEDSRVTADLVPRLEAKLDRALATLARVDRLLEQLERPDSTIGALLQDRALYDSVADLVRDTRRLVANTYQLTADLRRVTPWLPELVDEAFVEMRRVDDLLRALREHPLLRGGFEEPAPLRPTDLDGAADPYEGRSP